MRFLLLCFIFFTVPFTGVVQTVRTLIGNDNPIYRSVSIRNTPLFDKEEIKNRRIQTCFITHSPDHLHPEIIDTAFIFYFNQDGNIIKRISYDSYAGTTNDTLWQAPWDSRHSVKYIVKMDNAGDMVKATIWTIWKYQGNDFPEDTASIITSIYKIDGKLLEEEEIATQDYIDAWHCGTGLMPLIKYGYDQQGQVTHIRIDDWKTTATLSYQKQKIHLIIKREDGNMTTTDAITRTEDKREIKEQNWYGKIVLTKLEKGSKLLSKIAGDYGNVGEYYLQYISN